MQLFETEPGRPARTGRRSTGTSSPASSGGGRKRALAASRSLAARAHALRHGIWGPVLAKGAAILFGMLALAAIGAASLSRGSGVPLGPAPAGHAAAGRPASAALGTHPGGVAAAGLVPLAPSSPHVSPGSAELDGDGADGGAPPEPGARSPGLTADGKVILNRADASELRRLPGVGPKRAEAILALRSKLGGRFKRLSELLRVKGIGPKGLKKLEPHVVLDEPKQS